MDYRGGGDGDDVLSRLKADLAGKRALFYDYSGEGAAVSAFPDGYFQRHLPGQRLFHEALELFQLLLVSGGELFAACLAGFFLTVPGQPGAVLG